MEKNKNYSGDESSIVEESNEESGNKAYSDNETNEEATSSPSTTPEEIITLVIPLWKKQQFK